MAEIKLQFDASRVSAMLSRIAAAARQLDGVEHVAKMAVNPELAICVHQDGMTMVIEPSEWLRRLAHAVGADDVGMMRCTVDHLSQWYVPPDHCRQIKILLNGVEQRDVIEADESDGLIRRYVRNGHGKFFLGGDGDAESEIVHGIVSIEAPEWMRSLYDVSRPSRPGDAGLVASAGGEVEAEMSQYVNTEAREKLAELRGVIRLLPDSWRAVAVQLHDALIEVLRKTEELRAENDALRADAERYRWIRQQHNRADGRFSVAELGQGDWWLIDEVTGTPPNDLDTAVDAARGEA